MPTLADLLAQQALGLTLHVGSPATRFGDVRHADAAGERAWLAGDDLRLAEGPFTLPRPALDPLFTRSPAAIGYALTPRQRELPAPLADRAREGGVALFTIAPTVNPQRVEEAALRLVAAEALPALAGVASLGRYLLAALPSPKPERDLLERLHALSGSSFVLLSTWGAVLARSGPLGWPGLGAPPAELPEGRARVAGREALVLRVESGGRLRSLLVAIDADGALLPLLELARALLVVAALGRDAEAETARVARAALLGEWLSGADARALAGRLLQIGFDLDAPLTVMVAEAGAQPRGAHRPARSALDTLRRAGDDFFASLGVTALSETRSDHCVWVFGGAGGDAQLAPLQRALGAAGVGPVRLGAGLPQHDHARLSDAYRQAQLALQGLREAGGHATFDDLDPVYWVLRHQPEENLRALRDRLIGVVEEADSSGKLRRTLSRYLAAPGDLKGLAAELHIHVNTLRYRLGRIEELLGLPLSKPETLARLYLAERIDELLGS